MSNSDRPSQHVSTNEVLLKKPINSLFKYLLPYLSSLSGITKASSYLIIRLLRRTSYASFISAFFGAGILRQRRDSLPEVLRKSSPFFN